MVFQTGRGKQRPYELLFILFTGSYCNIALFLYHIVASLFGFYADKEETMSISRRAVRLTLSTTLAITALVALVPGSPASADQPYFQTFYENGTSTYQGGCAFDVIVHTEGTIRWMYHPNNGNPIVSIYHYDIRGTYTNALTGRFVSWAQDAVLKGYYQDGSLFIYLIGLEARINVPGQGRVVADVGRLILRYDHGSYDPNLVFEAGQWDNFSAVCSLLE